jgi:hypothetical protein
MNGESKKAEQGSKLPPTEAQMAEYNAEQAQKTDAQRAAEHDMAFGTLTNHMEDYYDNEHQADKRGG